VNHGLSLLRFPVKDMAAAKKLYGSLLGVAPYMDEPYYAGFRTGDLEIGLDPNGHKAGMTVPVGYWRVDDIDRTLQSLLDAGAQSQQAITDVGGGKRIASVTDADGNVIGLVQDA
jgi:predicted enzyme related to lactoylglutathione lyase